MHQSALVLVQLTNHKEAGSGQIRNDQMLILLLKEIDDLCKHINRQLSNFIVHYANMHGD